MIINKIRKLVDTKKIVDKKRLIEEIKINVEDIQKMEVSLIQ